MDKHMMIFIYQNKDSINCYNIKFKGKIVWYLLPYYIALKRKNENNHYNIQEKLKQTNQMEKRILIIIE